MTLIIRNSGNASNKCMKKENNTIHTNDGNKNNVCHYSEC